MTFVVDLAAYFFMILGAVFFGGVLPVFRRWDAAKLPLLLSFSAGLMLGSSFIHLMPESFELIGRKTSLFILLGFLFLYFFEKFITVHICETDQCEVHRFGISAFIGLFLHSLTDGIALGAGLLIPKLGLIVFIAIFAHKAPEAFSLTSILLHEKKERAKIYLANFALLLAIPLGAFLSFSIAGEHNQQMMGMALAFSAGTFIHVSLSDLLPEVHRHSNLKNQAFLFFMLGLGFMFILKTYVG